MNMYLCLMLQPPLAARQQVKAKPLNDISFGSGVTSSTAKKILDTLERMSTPLSVCAL